MCQSLLGHKIKHQSSFNRKICITMQACYS